MKIFISFLISVFAFSFANAQFVPQPLGGNVSVKSTVRGAFKPDSGLIVISMPDTATANKGPNIKKEHGILILVHDTLYFRDAVHKRWVMLSNSNMNGVEDIVVFNGNTICKTIGGVQTCYTISNTGGGNGTFTGIEQIIFSAPRTICYVKDSVTTCFDLPNSVDSAKKINDSTLCFYSGGIPECYPVIGNVIQTGPTDSLVVNGNLFCWYFGGNPTCLTVNNVGKFYDSTSLNFDSTKYIHWNNGVPIDSVTTLVRQIVGVGRIIVRDSSDGKTYFYFDSTGLSTGGSSTTTYTPIYDVPHLPEIKSILPAKGLTASASVANYPASSIDSVRAKLSTTAIGSSSTDRGGWLTSNLTGDSINVRAPFGVVWGHSIAEGHPGLHGMLHNTTGNVVLTYPDSAGQISYHLRQLTNMRWYNTGIGGELLTVTGKQRFLRDVCGQTINITGSNTKYLPGKPEVAVIITGINDIANAVSLTKLKADFEYIAAACQENNIRCVICNIGGDETASQQMLKDIAEMNLWFAKGALDQYGVTIVDFASWWRSSTYKDDAHGNGMLADDIHPTKVGYDSLSNFIFRNAKLPVLTKAILYTERSPAGFSGFSKPTGITINGTAYTLPSTGTIDSVPLTHYVQDSTNIKITASTNITGTSFTGFSHIEWMLDNNPLNEGWVTKKTTFTNGKINPTYATVTIKSQDVATRKLLEATNFDGFNAISVYNGGGSSNPYATIGNTAVLNNATLSVGYSGVGNAIESVGGIKVGRSQIQNLEIGYPTTPGTTGFGITVSGNSVVIHSTGAINGFIYKNYATQVPVPGGLANNATYGGFNVQQGIGSFGNGGVGIRHFSFVVTAPISDSVAVCTNCLVGGMGYAPSSVNTLKPHLGLFNTVGSNLFNFTSGNTSIGYSTIQPYKLAINGSLQINKDSVQITTANTYALFLDTPTGKVTRQLISSGGTTITFPNTALKYYTGYGTFGSLNDTARAAISVTNTGSGGASYSSSTGVISVPQNSDSIQAHNTRIGKNSDSLTAHNTRIGKNSDSLTVHNTRIGAVTVSDALKAPISQPSFTGWIGMAQATTTQMNAISSPAQGVQLYNTDLKALMYYDSAWGWTSDNTDWKIRNMIDYSNDFTGPLGSGTASLSDGMLTTSVGNGGVIDTGQAVTVNRIGLVKLSTGTNASGQAKIATGISTTLQTMLLGGGRIVFETSVNPYILPSAAERYSILSGFSSTNNSVFVSNGVLFVYDSSGVVAGSTASPNWQVCTDSANTRTFSNTGVAVTANTWYNLKIIVNAAGTSVDFYINDALVKTETRTIPITPVGMMTQIFKGGGTTARTLHVDYIRYKQKFTTSR